MHYEWLYYDIMYCLLKKENEFSDMLALKYAKKIAAIDIPLGYYYQGYIYWSREKYDIALLDTFPDVETKEYEETLKKIAKKVIVI